MQKCNRRFDIHDCNSICEILNLGGFKQPGMHNKILRPMVKELAQLDLQFLSYGQNTIKFCHF